MTDSTNAPAIPSKLQMCADSQNPEERMPRTIHGEIDSNDPTSGLLEHERFGNRDILTQNKLYCSGSVIDQSIQNLGRSPKIVHYHLTIQNCEGVEICVDNREQNFTQKTAYSADGQRLKRLSWIEVPSDPIDIGPSLSNARSIATTENNHIVPNNEEEMVFISPEAEQLFCHNDQVIIQESSTAPYRTETQSQVDDEVRSGMTSTMVNTDECGTALTNGSSQTDAPNQQSQYTQTVIPGYTSRARQAAARRTATSPFRRESAMFESHIGSQTTHDLNRSMASQHNFHRERLRRSRSTDREHSFGQRGIVVDTSSAAAASAHPSQRTNLNFHPSSHPSGKCAMQSLNA